MCLVDVEGIADAAGMSRDGLSLDKEVREQLELNATYDGYIEVQLRHIEQNRKLDEMKIPSAFDWDGLKGLSYESREKLGRLKPETIGQASRVSGVRPSDIALLIGHLKRRL